MRRLFMVSAFILASVGCGGDAGKDCLELGCPSGQICRRAETTMNPDNKPNAPVSDGFRYVCQDVNSKPLDDAQQSPAAK